MPTYVLMTKLGSEVISDPRGRKAVGKEWKQRVDKLCPDVKWVAHFALLGHYDFMDIYEAPSNEVAMQVSLISRSSGAIIAESWPATPYDKFLAAAMPVEDALIKERKDDD
jgi:uncharacterized protein with GYD domain